MTIRDNQNLNRRTISKEILLNYITYASDDADAIDVDDLLKFAKARSVMLSVNNIQILLVVQFKDLHATMLI